MRRRLALPILLPTVVGCLLLGACGGDKGTEPAPVTGVRAAHQATWSLTHGMVTAVPGDSCGSGPPFVYEAPLKTTTLITGAWEGRTFTGTWYDRVVTWEDFEVSGTLEATTAPGDTLLTDFTVHQHIVWHEAPDRRRHETAYVTYSGPGLVLGDESWGWIFREFGTGCCDGLSIVWSTWLEEDPDCTWEAVHVECADLSSLHVGFYPRD